MTDHYNYRAVEVYCLIDQWLDELIADGKIKVSRKSQVERGDIGRLNGKIIESLKDANPTREIHYSEANRFKNGVITAQG